MKKNVLLLLLACLISLLAAEAILRFMGYEPWILKPYANRPSIHKYDPVMGWTMKEGSFFLPPYHPSGTDIRSSFLKDGMRKSHISQTDGGDRRQKFILVGGSFTQGWAISDNETFPWKLQESLPQIEFMNYAVAGYGTYQSLLTLERVLPTIRNPKVVIYGFITHHEDRNLASANRMEALARASRKEVYVPFVTINNGHLVRQQALRSSSWPLTEYSSTLTLLQKAFMKLKVMERQTDKQQVTEQLLIEMRKLCEQYQTSLFVIVLSGTERKINHYMKFLENNNISAANCTYPLTEDMRVKGEGHPNGKHNSKWATCIKKALIMQGLIKQ